MDRVQTIEQKIKAGSNWTGAAPTTTPVTVEAVKAFPADTVGGLFDFDVKSGSWRLWQIERIIVDFNGVATKGIYIRKTGNPDIPIYESTAGAETKVLITDKLVMAPDESLVITSVGAAAAMFARVTARPLTGV